MVHHVKRAGKQKPKAPVSEYSLTRGFRLARAAAGIAWKEGRTASTFHELRSLAARLYSDQYSPEFAQAILGHKSASTTAMYRDVSRCARR
jgi:integrase